MTAPLSREDSIKQVVMNVMAADRLSRGLPALTPAEQEALDLEAIARAARRE